MNSKTLRRACEAANLRIEQSAKGNVWWVSVRTDDTSFSMGSDHPALPAYVASRLVERLTEPQRDLYVARLLATVPPVSHVTTDVQFLQIGIATDEQRIAAALEVLDD